MALLDDKTTLDHAGGPPPEDEQERVSLILYHRDGAKVVPLYADKPVVVGRAWPADAVIADLSLSRQHARFRWDEGGVFVEDLGSTNGTVVQGKRIVEARVQPGEPVVLGAVTASVHFTTPQAGLTQGVDGHERFIARLEDEVTRARSFSRPLSLLMVRAIGREEAHVSHWCPRVRNELRSVDHLTIYGPGSVLILLPEIGRAEAWGMGSALVQPERPAEPRLVCGVATCPDSASTADQLVESARIAGRRATLGEPVQMAAPLYAGDDTSGVVILSGQMRQVFDLVRRVARANVTVLVQGETGVGKEVIARAIHRDSPRASRTLQCVNCGAIPPNLIESVLFGHEKGAFTGAEKTTKGLFEQAHGGTLFLDEIGELSQATQAALLRALETKTINRVGSPETISVDVRVIAATHRDLDAMVSQGSFRLDLLYRLNTMQIRIPSLRERPEEIEPLTELFLKQASKDGGVHVRSIDSAARALLRAYPWPGNVRELRNVIERAVILCSGEEIGVADLSERVRDAGGPLTSPTEMPPRGDEPDRDFKDRVRDYELDLIVDALRRCNGNQTAAAKLLKVPLRTLVHKMKTLGIRKTYEIE